MVMGRWVSSVLDGLMFEEILSEVINMLTVRR